MSEIDWSKVTQPFLPNINDEHWITDSALEMKTLDNGKVSVTNPTAKVTVEADNLDDAIRELNLKVQETMKSNAVFIGRSYL
jgi:hypothetical protein